jgi:hypothetical protein
VGRRIAFARKIKELTSRLSARQIDLPEDRAPESQVETLFRLIERRAAAFTEFMNQFAYTRLSFGNDLITILVQPPDCTWWATYLIWIRRVEPGRDELVTTFVEPSGMESLPEAVTRSKGDGFGDLDFAAGGQLDLVCQSIIRLLERPQSPKTGTDSAGS